MTVFKTIKNYQRVRNGKYDIKMKNDSCYIQTGEGKKVKFYPIYNINANDITIVQCKEIEEKNREKAKKKKGKGKI